MGIFSDNVKDFLIAQEFRCKDETSSCMDMPDGMETFLATSSDGILSRRIVLLSPTAKNAEEAGILSDAAWKTVSALKDSDGRMPLILTEDRWNSARGMSQDRLLAHMELFFPVYARNCEVRRIDKKDAAEFLKRAHSYGDAACRYRYGLYLKRHTGHVANELPDGTQNICRGTLVAVATFSNARKWLKGDKVIRSYEWTRYASLPGLRVNGGMGKLLKAFIEDAAPDDVMSYADLEWSEGKVYGQLGFVLEGYKSPVCFRIDTTTWQRFVHRGQGDMTPEHKDNVFFQNFGSAKYRLKLTEYE